MCFDLILIILYIYFSNENLGKHIEDQIEEITKNAGWESLFDVKVQMDSEVIEEYGWTDLSKEELLERKELLSKWHEMEMKSVNAIGMASVMQLMKVISRATKDSNRAEKRAFTENTGDDTAQAGGGDLDMDPNMAGASLTAENLSLLQQSLGRPGDSDDDAKSV